MAALISSINNNPSHEANNTAEKKNPQIIKEFLNIKTTEKQLLAGPTCIGFKLNDKNRNSKA